MKKLFLAFVPAVDVILLPFVYPSALLLKGLRKIGVFRLPLCKNALLQIGVFPIRDHYYEPQFNYTETLQPFSEDRNLPGIDWNISGQLKLLSQLECSNELSQIPLDVKGSNQFYLNNGAFESGDAEYWYQLIRYFKPRRIFEIGSGYSTLMAVQAIGRNYHDDPSYSCRHVCIEPYEMPWLRDTGVTVIRQRVEDLDVSFFSELEENDVLFIDSSHVIRPQGDVLFEYLEILPSLKKGVIVHAHDIFTPKNYIDLWLVDQVKFWNEQYLLEAFLSNNTQWRILGALNLLKHQYYDDLRRVAPFLTAAREPGSFYIQKIE
jgi:hypothetical protein